MGPPPPTPHRPQRPPRSVPRCTRGSGGCSCDVDLEGSVPRSNLRVHPRDCDVDGCGKLAPYNTSRLCLRHTYLKERYGSTDDPLTPRPCVTCRRHFTPNDARMKFCSDPCRRTATLWTKAERNANRCRIIAFVCSQCGEPTVRPFAGGRTQNRTCSVDCQKRAKRSRTSQR